MRCNLQYKGGLKGLYLDPACRFMDTHRLYTVNVSDSGYYFNTHGLRPLLGMDSHRPQSQGEKGRNFNLLKVE